MTLCLLNTDDFAQESPFRAADDMKGMNKCKLRTIPSDFSLNTPDAI